MLDSNQRSPPPEGGGIGHYPNGLTVCPTGLAPATSRSTAVLPSSAGLGQS